MAHRTCKTCGTTFDAAQRTHVYCSPACRPYSTRTKTDHERTTTQRGYGYWHQQERKKRATEVEAGTAVCCLCQESIEPGSKWHLDHDDDRTSYRGIAHAACNLRDGRRKQALRLVAELYGFASIAELTSLLERGAGSRRSVA